MRLDHLAYRVRDKEEATDFLSMFLNYSIAKEFNIELEDGSVISSIAMKCEGEPDIFVSSGPPGSVIDDWVTSHGGGGIHHIAYAVKSVKKAMDFWRKEHGLDFTTDEPIVGQYLTQAFTKPIISTGIIYELIERAEGMLGFEPENVKKLMKSTKGL